MTDECDYPFQVKKIPQVTSSTISNNLTSKQINKKVALSKHRGLGISHLDPGILKTLNPNLILTQELCEVCAIPYTEVKKATKILDDSLKIISLEPESIEDIFENILEIAKATKSTKKAHKLVKTLKERLDNINTQLKKSNTATKPQILLLEWLDPAMVAGHWSPQMIKLAGGKMLITKPGQKSSSLTNSQIKSSNPDILIIAPCGFSIKRTLEEKNLIDKIIKTLKSSPAVKNKQIFLMDGNAYLTRPGPRIIDGVEILSQIIHPQIFNKSFKNSDYQPYDILTTQH